MIHALVETFRMPAGAEVDPLAFVTVTEYMPWLAAFGDTTRVELIAPAIAVPLRYHWNPVGPPAARAVSVISAEPLATAPWEASRARSRTARGARPPAPR